MATAHTTPGTPSRFWRPFIIDNCFWLTSLILEQSFHLINTEPWLLSACIHSYVVVFIAIPSLFGLADLAFLLGVPGFPDINTYARERFDLTASSLWPSNRNCQLDVERAKLQARSGPDEHCRDETQTIDLGIQSTSARTEYGLASSVASAYWMLFCLLLRLSNVPSPTHRLSQNSFDIVAAFLLAACLICARWCADKRRRSAQSLAVIGSQGCCETDVKLAFNI